MSTIPNKTMGLCDRSYKSQKLPESLLKACLARKIDNIHNALLVALSKAKAIAIEKYKTLVGRGKVYWAYYVNKEGKKRATFISPKEFQGYRWFNDFSTVINMKSGEIYQVSDRHCTCKSWQYHVKTGKRKTCKHQRMRQLEILPHKFPVVNLSDSLPTIAPSSNQPKLKVISKPKSQQLNLDRIQLKPGLTLEKIKDSTKIGCYLKAWHKNNPLSTPRLKKIGELYPSDRGFKVSTIGQKTKLLVSELQNAIDSILRQINVTYESINEAYNEAIDLSRSTA
ncbi:MAG: hypothetical protein ACFBSE_18675 [Prochloraceae cyanobacterium]